MKDANGKEIDIDIFNYTNGLNWRPQPFECIITPRNERIKETILREGQQALSELEQYNGKTKYFPSFMILLMVGTRCLSFMPRWPRARR